MLNQGHRLTAIGGSDNHDAVDGRRGSSPVGAQSPVGMPATVIYAESLSQPAILQGIRSGRVFIDLDGARPDRVLDLSAATGGGPEMAMGGVLKRVPGQVIRARVHVAGAKGSHVDLVVDGQAVPVPADPVLHGADETLAFDLPSASVVRWFRTDVRAADGRRVLIGNPIYLSPMVGDAH